MCVSLRREASDLMMKYGIYSCSAHWLRLLWAASEPGQPCCQCVGHPQLLRRDLSKTEGITDLTAQGGSEEFALAGDAGRAASTCRGDLLRLCPACGGLSRTRDH